MIQGDRAATFEKQRPRLFTIAYRMMGTRADAEDVLQECWLRWNSARREVIQNPAAWLGTVTTRICVDQIRSVENKRFDYVGPWLPEPVAHAGDLSDSLSYAFLVLLQTLSPPERCVLLLRDVFAYEFREIAEVLETGEAHCRKLLERARKQISAGRARQRADRKRHRELLERFAHACRTGDSGGLETLLAADARLRTDGGGKVPSALNPIVGANPIARFFVGIMKKIPDGVTSEFTTRLGEPAIESRYPDGRLQSVLLIEPSRDGDAIQEVFVITNPDKLQS